MIANSIRNVVMDTIFWHNDNICFSVTSPYDELGY